MDFKKFLKGNKEQNLKNLLVVLLVGIALVIVASFFKDSGGNASKTSSQKSSSNTNSSTHASSDQYEQNIQNELKTTLQDIQGVGNVQVMVTFESGDEQVPAYNVTGTEDTITEKDADGGQRTTKNNNNGSSVVTTTGSDGTTSPYIVKTNKPKVLGVCVVAEGAEVDLTRLRLTKAVMDLLDVSEDKVNVYPMKK